MGATAVAGKRIGGRRWLAAGVVGMLVALATVPAWATGPAAAAGPPAITLSTTSASPGTDVQVSGTGFTPGEKVQPVWNYSGPGTGVPQASYFYFNPTVVADASGSVTTDFFVPDTAGGTYTVAAVGLTSQLVATAPFTVTPRIDIGDSFGSAGSVLTLAGWGLGAKEPASVTWDATGAVMATATTDVHGAFQGRTFAVPAGTTAGTYGVTMTGGVSGLVAHATFTVGAPPQSPSAGPDDWATFGFNAQQTRDYPASATGFGTSALSLKWQTLTAPVRELDSSTTVSHGIAYVGTVHGTLYAMNAATGAVLWTFAAHGPIYGSPNVVGGVLYFGTVDLPNEGIVGNEVYALDATTGTQLWEDTLPNGGVWYAPTVDSGRVIVPMANKEGQSGGVVAYSATTGLQLWNDNLAEGVWSPASVDPTGTSLYLDTGNPCLSVGTPSPGDGCSGSVLDIDPATGSIVWSYRVPDLSGDDDCGTAPAYDNGALFVGCKNGIEYSFNATTGAILWQFNTGLTGDSGIFSSAAVANGVVYFGAGDAKIHALSETTGTQLWSYPTTGAVIGSPIVADGAVYAASAGGTLYALDLSGHLLASAALGGPTLASPSLADGVLYQTVKTGNVDAFTVAAHGTLDHLVLSPATATVASGTPQAYTATGYDQYGNSLGDVTGSTAFSIGPDGTCAGASCSATVAGPHTVTGTDGTATGTATLTVTGTGPLDHLVLSPSTASVGAGVSQAYTATGYDRNGHSLGDVTASTTFSIGPDGACAAATCSATTTGPHTVTGTDGTATGTATLTVKAPTVPAPPAPAPPASVPPTSVPPVPVAPAGRTFVGLAATPDGRGYWIVDSRGDVVAEGDAVGHGSLSGKHLNAPIAHIVATPDGGGYWMVAGDGGIFSFGDARFYGSMGGRHLDAPVVALAPTPDGRGYWLVASDGGIFAFGDAPYDGSMGGRHLNQPVVGMAADPVTGGYWEVATDGGIFSFHAPFFGSTGSIRLNRPINGMSASMDGGGYRFVASDGGIFNEGDARFFGSEGGAPLRAPVVGMATDPATGGYWLVASDGGVFSFDAPFEGSAA